MTFEEAGWGNTVPQIIVKGFGSQENGRLVMESYR
jgi:hypothetical protein